MILLLYVHLPRRDQTTGGGGAPYVDAALGGMVQTLAGKLEVLRLLILGGIDTAYSRRVILPSVTRHHHPSPRNTLSMWQIGRR